MKFRIRFAQQIVGVFVLLAVLGLAGVLILLGANQRWFARNYHFASRFKSAEGLSVGMSLKLKGFEIGKVRSIALSPDNMVDISFYIYDTYYDKVLPWSVLELASSPIGIGGGLRFHPGLGPGPPLEEFSFIPSLDLPEGKRLVAQGRVHLAGEEDMIGSVVARIGPMLDKTTATLASVQTLTNSLNRQIAGQGGGPITDVLSGLTGTTDQINELLARLTAVTGNVETLTARLQDPKGLVPKLLDAKGSVATLLDDDNRLFDQITMALEEMNTVIAELSGFTGYLNDTQPQITGLLEKGRAALDQGADVLEAAKNNPLLRGGVPVEKEQPSTFQSYRDKDF